MKKFKRLLPAVLVCIFLLTAITPIYAGSEPTEKEEVIYVKLGTDGGVKDIYAVNIFGGGEITDYGDYSSIEMLNTTDKITQTQIKSAFQQRQTGFITRESLIMSVCPGISCLSFL